MKGNLGSEVEQRRCCYGHKMKHTFYIVDSSNVQNDSNGPNLLDRFL